MILPRKSSTVHDAPWDFIRCPQFILTHQLLHVSPQQNKSKDVLITNGVAKYADLDDNSTTSTKVLGDVNRNAKESCRVASNARPPKKVVAGPVRNAGRSLMLQILDNKYSNSLVADQSAELSSEKRSCKMLEMGWRGFLGVRTRMLWLVVSHLALRLPHHKRVCFTIRCCSKDQRWTYPWPA